MGVQVQATNQLNGTINELNAVCELEARDYDGSGSGPSAWSVRKTRNPAAMFLYILQDSKINKKPVPDSRIDWAALEDWYEFCETKGFECNVQVTGNVTVEKLLSQICSTSRASWAIIDNQYTVDVDKPKNTIVQYFTPRNSRGFVGNKSFADKPVNLRMKFIDAGPGYVESERIVNYDVSTGNVGYDSELSGLTQDVNLFGVTSGEQAAKIGAYQLATIYLRPEVYTFSVDIEYLICTRGDRVQINHQVPLFGLANGRINSVTDNGTDTTGFVSDGQIKYEDGKSYGITIRKQDGTSITKEVVNPASGNIVYSHDVEFSSVLSGTGDLNKGDLFLFGELGSETRDLLVSEIEPGENFGEATLKCVDYSPGVFNADSGTIPAYDPGISVYASDNSTNLADVLDAEQAIKNLQDSEAEKDAISVLKTSTNTIYATGGLQSENFITGQDGWQISGNGDAEFNNIVARGQIEATSGTLGGLTVDGTITVGSGGSITGSNYTFDDTGGKIANWEIQQDVLRSATSGARLELDSSKNRLAVFDSSNVKVVSGYLDQLPVYNGSGTAESATSTTLTDTDKSWVTDQFINLNVVITGGTGAGQTRTVASNTADTLTVSSSWTTTPDNTSTYEIRFGAGAYGHWSREGDTLRFSGDATYENGSWLLKHDASYQIEDDSGNKVVRLGTYNGRKGLFVNEDNLGYSGGDPAPSGPAIELSPSHMFVGDTQSYLHYDVNNQDLTMRLVSFLVASLTTNVQGVIRVGADNAGPVDSLTNPVEITTEDVASPSWGLLSHASELRLAVGWSTPANGDYHIAVDSNGAVTGQKYDGSSWVQQWLLGGANNELTGVSKVSIGNPPDTAGGLNVNDHIYFNIAGNDLRYITDGGRNLWTLTESPDGTFSAGSKKWVLSYDENSGSLTHETLTAASGLYVKDGTTGGYVFLDPNSGDLALYNPTYGTEWQLNARNDGRIDIMNGSTRAMRITSINDVFIDNGDLTVGGDIYMDNEFIQMEGVAGNQIPHPVPDPPGFQARIYFNDSVGTPNIDYALQVVFPDGTRKTLADNS
jgi:hypothetical protein